MAFAFSELAILWTFHNQFPSQYSPTSADLHEWDDQLVNRYDAKLNDLLAEYGIPITRENRSRILMLAVVSAGGDGTRTQVRNACKYFKNASALDLDPEPSVDQ